ncbi:ABC transporter permease [Streptomyces xiamenensis]
MTFVRTYLLLATAAYRAQLQYRSNLLLTLAGGVAYQGTGLLFLWVITARFGDLGGWSMAEIAFLYGMRVTAHGLLVVPTSQLHHLDVAIRTGEFDRYLVRPAGVLTQLLCRQVHLPTLGDLATGIAVLVLAAGPAGFSATPAALLYLVLALIGGAMVEGALQLACASFSFRMLSNLALRGLIDDLMNTFGGYPLKAFPDAARLALTYLVPVAFVAYLPAGVLLDRTDGLHVTAWLAYGAPLAGPLLYAAAYALWRGQLRHYAGSGT